MVYVLYGLGVISDYLHPPTHMRRNPITCFLRSNVLAIANLFPRHILKHKYIRMAIINPKAVLPNGHAHFRLHNTEAVAYSHAHPKWTLAIDYWHGKR